MNVSTTIPATIENKRSLAVVAVMALRFRQLAAGAHGTP